MGSVIVIRRNAARDEVMRYSIWDGRVEFIRDSGPGERFRIIS
jgi:hypothetical protein